jgi:hypothetical protein
MKDALGNELKAGDLVALQLERPLIWGVVEEVHDGGILTGLNRSGEAQLRPGQVRIKSLHTIEAAPNVPVVAVLALRDPSAGVVLDAAVESTENYKN